MYLQVHVMVAYLSNFTWLWLTCFLRRLCHHQTPFTFEGVASSGPPLWSFSLALGMPCCLAEWPGAADCCAGWCSFAACQHMAVAQMFAADALTRTCHHESPSRARCNKGGGPRAISLRWCRLPACVGLQVHQRTGGPWTGQVASLKSARRAPAGRTERAHACCWRWAWPPAHLAAADVHLGRVCLELVVDLARGVSRARSRRLTRCSIIARSPRTCLCTESLRSLCT